MAATVIRSPHPDVEIPDLPLHELVLAGAAEVASGFTVSSPDLSGSFKHVLLDESSRLTFFADVIPLRFIGIGEVISLGDVFLALGLGVFLEHELRRPRRYFKRGAQAQPGSANRGDRQK